MTWSGKLWREEFQLPTQNQTMGENSEDDGWSGQYDYLGHEDVLSSESVVWVSIVVRYNWNGEVCVLAQKVHGSNLRFCFDSGHESASNPRDEFRTIDEGNKISLKGCQRPSSGSEHGLTL